MGEVVRRLGHHGKGPGQNHYIMLPDTAKRVYLVQPQPELFTNGDFSAGSAGWTLTQASVVDGELVVNTADGTYAAGVQAVTGLTIGAIYKVIVQVKAVTFGALRVALGGSAEQSAELTVPGTYEWMFTATAANHSIEFKRATAVQTVFRLDNARLRRITA